MRSGASVQGHEQLRLFCALRLPETVLDRVTEWQRGELGGAPARIVPRDSLHLTLAFLGRRPATDAPDIVRELAKAAAAATDPLLLEVRAYRETRSVGMLVLADQGGHAAGLADDLHARLEALGVYVREARPWLPHLTVLRFRARPRLRPAVPDLGHFGPSDAALYTSLLRPGGAQYEVLESVALGG